MKYQYNYSFFRRWLEANKNIKYKTILSALGSMSNSSLERWRIGDAPIPIINLLRFCNAFDVPLSAFIRDCENEGETEVEYSANDQWQPNGGYFAADETVTPGSRALRNPLDVEIIKSVLPDIAIPQHEGLQNNDAKTQADRINQTERLLDIIEEQQKTITYLIEQLSKTQTYERKNSKGTLSCMVAEDILP